MHIEQYGVYHAASEIAEKARVVIGIDLVLPEKEPTIALDFHGGTLADLLDLLVSKVPDYRWQEGEDGVIQFFRAGSRVSLMDVIMSYPGAKKKTREEIWKDLSNRPEILAWLKSNNCSRQEYLTGKEFKWNNVPISIDPGPISVRELFDQVTLKSDSKTWLVLESPLSTRPCTVALMLW